MFITDGLLSTSFRWKPLSGVQKQKIMSVPDQDSRGDEGNNAHPSPTIACLRFVFSCYKST